MRRVLFEEVLSFGQIVGAKGEVVYIVDGVSGFPPSDLLKKSKRVVSGLDFGLPKL